ncbi:MAG: KamA family protein [Salinivirgaceae bacterium]|jgi:lysine 2,3-aminomutase|nr:KamA family protein [Salinivirgaceae bacterium]
MQLSKSKNMETIQKLDKIAITVKSHKLLQQLLDENTELEVIMRNAKNETEALIGVRQWVMGVLKESSDIAIKYYKREYKGHDALTKLKWNEIAAIRLLDYIDNAGRVFNDQNLRGQVAVSNPIKLIWLAVNRGTGGAKPYFFEDMVHLFRQFTGKEERQMPTRDDVEKWMERYPSGLDPRIVKLREENRERIINILIDKIDSGEIISRKYTFEEDMSREQKFLKMLEWWDDHIFHLQFAVRSPDLLNELLGNSLDPDTMKVLYEAEEQGIPFFVNPYYLSLLHVRVPYFAVGADLAIRYYVIYSKQLISEFGHIVAWEKEDIVKPGEPNAAGWLLPSKHNVHRRYPEVAILIPDTVGRACGGLCASCQRLYDFQSGHLNFNLDKLKPDGTWQERLQLHMEYFEKDTQLRDILITGGDALMSSDKSLKQMLNAVVDMAVRKQKANESRADGEKYAEMLRIRLGTRLPVYLPQRITPELIEILADFKRRASDVGIQQFVIQTHFESPMEITPVVKEAIDKLIRAGWTVTNQHVFTSASSRRGHTAKLRKVLNQVGVLPYYTFSVKGYMENNFNFATNARAVQEQMEEKVFGTIPEQEYNLIKTFPLEAENMVENVERLRKKHNLPFIGTDRNVLNLPGVGKSLTFRVIGITRYGRRILEFDHDATRTHSPIIHDIGRIVIIESKSISEYLQQLSEFGENVEEYTSLYGYSIGETENRLPIYEYPEYDFKISDEMTNLELPEKK